VNLQKVKFILGISNSDSDVFSEFLMAEKLLPEKE
jgi:hypothetical protein